MRGKRAKAIRNAVIKKYGALIWRKYLLHGDTVRNHGLGGVYRAYKKSWRVFKAAA